MKAIPITRTVPTRRTILIRALAALVAAFAAMTALPQNAEAAVYIGVSAGFPPPPLPVYEQPPVPGPGYLWTPGYWAWDGAEYYWVPGTWVVAPFYGALWTPGYWGWDGAVYVFHPGYWGRQVGFYGGINYGFGYTGIGYAGGYWGPRGFYYNRAVNRVDNVHITNIYNRTVVNHIEVNRISYNGGRGGVGIRPTPQQVAFARESRMGPVAAQRQQMAMAMHNPALRASVNHGAPPIAATARPGAFNGAGVMPAYHAAHVFAPTPNRSQPLSISAIHGQPNRGAALPSARFAPHAMPSRVPDTNRPYANGINRGAYQPTEHSIAPRHLMNTTGSSASVYRPHSPSQYHVQQPVLRAQPAYRMQRQQPVRQMPSPYHMQQPMYRPQSQYHVQPLYHAPTYHPAPHPAGGTTHDKGGFDGHHG